MFTFAMVVIPDENGAASHSVVVPIDAIPAPGDELRLGSGEIVTVQIVVPDSDQPERVSLYSTRG